MGPRQDEPDSGAHSAAGGVVFIFALDNGACTSTGRPLGTSEPGSAARTAAGGELIWRKSGEFLLATIFPKSPKPKSLIG